MKLILALILIFFSLLFPIKSFADEKNFDTDYTVTYEPREDELTKVTLQIEIKNKTTEFFAKSYSIQTGFKDIDSINASDSKGVLSYKTTENDIGTLVEFDFNEKVVGINKSQKFTLSFETDQIAKKEGQIWELNIPGVSKQADYESFTAIVTAPKSFGEPVYIKPSVKKIASNSSSLKFTKEELDNSGISISYGETQIYEFDLDYNLQNKNLFPVTTEIAIPSNNSYQEVIIQSMNPKPLDVEIDTDGNWIAKYRLNPSQKLNVEVNGKAKISLNPRKEKISNEEKVKYTKTQKFWETDDSEIKKLALELKTPEEIYNYVVKTLTYDSKRVTEDQIRAGGKGVLKNPSSAVCLEFTDLFISIARSAGIPARQVEGYANTNNSSDRPLSLVGDILHSWPQYYDFEKEAWVNVDPTWENTTKGIDYFDVFDFDHLAFVIKGSDSEYPIPAGGYKIGKDKTEKDVNVFPSNFFEKNSPSLSVSTNFNEKYFGGFPLSGKIIIKNNSNTISPNQSINVSLVSDPKQNKDIFIDKIPPFGMTEVPVNFNSTSFLTNKTDTIKITLAGEEIESKISILPIYNNIYIYLALILIIISVATIILSVYYYRSRNIPLSE